MCVSAHVISTTSIIQFTIAEAFCFNIENDCV